MQYSKINSGKHKGKTLPQIIFNDADWFFYMYDNGRFEGQIAREAHELYQRARSVRVPQRNGKKMLVEYEEHRNGRSGSRKFRTMHLIPDGHGIESLNVASSIDFYKPRSYGNYDKSGYEIFVSELKAILFGNRSKRMNRKACEEFFNNDDNFI